LNTITLRPSQSADIRCFQTFPECLLGRERILCFAGRSALWRRPMFGLGKFEDECRLPTSDNAAVDDSSSGQPLRLSGARARSPDR
jgi:hypothetical protein